MSYRAYVELNNMKNGWKFYTGLSLEQCLDIVGCSKKALKPVLPTDLYKRLIDFLFGKNTFVWFTHKELLQMPILIPFKTTTKIFRPKLVEEIKSTHNLFKTLQEELSDIANKNFLKSEDVRLVLEYNI